MLQHLHVKNLAVAAEISVEFGEGLNVLTGETGAGKSILVDALGLLAGARADGDSIRRGADELSVTGSFVGVPDETIGLLEGAGIALDDKELVVRRIVAKSGRNKVFINDQPATLRLLGQVASAILRIHTQREELGLVAPEIQRQWLDRSAGVDGRELLDTVADNFGDYRRLAERWDRLTGNERLRIERLDLLGFQAGEIDAALLEAGEEDRLRERRTVLRNIEAIRTGLGGAVSRLFDEDDAAIDRLSQAERQLESITEWEPGAAEAVRLLAELRVSLEDIVRGLRGRLTSVEVDPGGLDAVEDRLVLIERLLRKYGNSSAEVLEHRLQVGKELEDLQADDDERLALEERLKESLAEYRRSALALSQARRAWSKDLADRVHRELADLSMSKARFKVGLHRRLRADSQLESEGERIEFSAHGIDDVSFELAANPGEGGGPLAKVASGGELSRVYLALQLGTQGGTVADDDPYELSMPAMVFDEVDAGIGGAEAAALGAKLARLAGVGQILAVTHLPQVAAQADLQFRIQKGVEGGRTQMTIRRLDRTQRVEEIARMLGGKEITKASKLHAEELVVAGARPKTEPTTDETRDQVTTVTTRSVKGVTKP